MKVRQKQWQLYYLGFLPESEIDGIQGPITKAATAELQKYFGIKIDGVFGTHTANMTKETITSYQNILNDYMQAGLLEDGLAGPNTVKATKLFQKLKGLPQTGVANAETRIAFLEFMKDKEPTKTPNDTNSWWDEIEYFTRDELKCKCGGRYCNGFPAEPKEMTVRLADRARKHFGKPAYCVSFLRCKTWNAIKGGVANSQHMYGEAMDIRIEGVTANDLYSFFKKQPEVRYTYKINDTNVHFDIPKGKR